MAKKKDDFEVFDGKSFSSLLQDIYTNSLDNKGKIETYIADLVNKVRSGNIKTIGIIAPYIKEYLEVAVKNDDTLVKIAQIAQKSELAKGKGASAEGMFDKHELDEIINNYTERTKEIDNIAKKIPDVSSEKE